MLRWGFGVSALIAALVAIGNDWPRLTWPRPTTCVALALLAVAISALRPEADARRRAGGIWAGIAGLCVVQALSTHPLEGPILPWPRGYTWGVHVSDVVTCVAAVVVGRWIVARATRTPVPQPWDPPDA